MEGDKYVPGGRAMVTPTSQGMPRGPLQVIAALTLFCFAAADLFFAIHLARELHASLHRETEGASAVPLNWIIADSLWFLLATVTVLYAALGTWMFYNSDGFLRSRVLMFSLALSGLAAIPVLVNTTSKYAFLVEEPEFQRADGGIPWLISEVLAMDGAWCNGQRDLLRVGLVFVTVCVSCWVASSIVRRGRDGIEG